MSAGLPRGRSAHTGGQGLVVRTTGGDIDPDLVGPTSMHEHLQCDATVWYRTERPEDERFRSVEVGPESIADVRWHAFSFGDNLHLDDPEAAVEGLQRFAAVGGRTVVEATTIGLSPRPDVVAFIARQANVNVVHGAGFYVHPSHPADVCTASVDELDERVDREVTTGVVGSAVLPGILGEIGMSAPPETCERNVLRAAARVAARWGMSVVIHVDGGGRFGTEHVEDCVGEGLPADRVICGHMDERLDAAYHRDIVKMGATVAFDTFGSELKYSGLFDHPSDTERMQYVVGLLDGGWEKQIVLAHDVFVKAHLHGFGGNGYEHLLARVLPTLRARYGLSAAVLDQLMVHNPRHHLACSPPAPPGTSPDPGAPRGTRAS